jgi:hypothetical protein
VLFLCGYVVQQNTLKNIREQIKPRPLPDYSKLYVPPDPGASPYETAPEGSDVQVIEVAYASHAEEAASQHAGYVEEGEQLVQGADGGFLRKSKGRRRKQKPLAEQPPALAGSESDDTPSSRRAADVDKPADGAQGGLDSDSTESLSRAARRKRIKEDFMKINGPDPKPGANPYRRRRMW